MSKDLDLRYLAVAAVSGLIFGFGLYISQMTDPLKVLRFLDFTGIATGQWDVLFQHSVTDWDRLPGAAIIRGAGGDSVVVAASGVDWTVSGAPAAVADVRAALLDG